jgi:uncharacterized membrane protein
MSLSNRCKNFLSVLRTTGIGGVFFLLPLIVIGVLLGKIAQVCVITARWIDSYLPFHSVNAYSILLAIGFASILFLCFLAGVIAKRSIARQFTQKIEKYLLIVFPRYAVVKDQLSGNIGGHPYHENLKPILVNGVDEMTRLGLEVERDTTGSVTVYFPGSPDPWSGFVAIVPANRIVPIQVDFLAAFSTMERLGREFQAVTRWSELSSREEISPKRVVPGNSVMPGSSDE